MVISSFPSWLCRYAPCAIGFPWEVVTRLRRQAALLLCARKTLRLMSVCAPRTSPRYRRHGGLTDPKIDFNVRFVSPWYIALECGRQGARANALPGEKRSIPPLAGFMPYVGSSPDRARLARTASADARYMFVPLSHRSPARLKPNWTSRSWGLLIAPTARASGHLDSCPAETIKISHGASKTEYGVVLFLPSRPAIDRWEGTKR